MRRWRELRVGCDGRKLLWREVPRQHFPSSWSLKGCRENAAPPPHPSTVIECVSVLSGSLAGCLAAHHCVGRRLRGSRSGNLPKSLGSTAGTSRRLLISEVSRGETEYSGRLIPRLEEKGPLITSVPGVSKLGPRHQIRPAIYFCQ